MGRHGCDHANQNAVKASEVDVHVVDWNALNTNLIVTGGKDKIVKVWDWRKLGNSSAKKAENKGENVGKRYGYYESLRTKAKFFARVGRHTTKMSSRRPPTTGV